MSRAPWNSSTGARLPAYPTGPHTAITRQQPGANVYLQQLQQQQQQLMPSLGNEFGQFNLMPQAPLGIPTSRPSSRFIPPPTTAPPSVLPPQSYPATTSNPYTYNQVAGAHAYFPTPHPLPPHPPYQTHPPPMPAVPGLAGHYNPGGLTSTASQGQQQQQQQQQTVGGVGGGQTNAQLSSIVLQQMDIIQRQQQLMLQMSQKGDRTDVSNPSPSVTSSSSSVHPASTECPPIQIKNEPSDFTPRIEDVKGQAESLLPAIKQEITESNTQTITVAPETAPPDIKPAVTLGSITCGEGSSSQYIAGGAADLSTAGQATCVEGDRDHQANWQQNSAAWSGPEVASSAGQVYIDVAEDPAEAITPVATPLSTPTQISADGETSSADSGPGRGRSSRGRGRGRGGRGRGTSNTSRKDSSAKKAGRGSGKAGKGVSPSPAKANKPKKKQMVAKKSTGGGKKDKQKEAKDSVGRKRNAAETAYVKMKFSQALYTASEDEGSPVSSHLDDVIDIDAPPQPSQPVLNTKTAVVKVRNLTLIQIKEMKDAVKDKRPLPDLKKSPPQRRKRRRQVSATEMIPIDLDLFAKPQTKENTPKEEQYEYTEEKTKLKHVEGKGKIKLPIKLATSKNKCTEPKYSALNKTVTKELDGITTYQCALCPFTGSDVQHHIETSHPDVEIDNFVSISGSNLFMACHHCNYIAIERMHLWTHFEEKHKVPRLFKRESKSITNSSLPCLSDKQKRRALELYKCPVCAYASTQPKHVVIHMLKEHLSDKDHIRDDRGCVCVVQEKRGNITMERHVHVCTECFSVFQAYDAAKQHLYNLHSHKNMLYSCMYCEEQFVNSVKTLVHCMKEHIGKQPYCGVTIIRKGKEQDPKLLGKKQAVSSDEEDLVEIVASPEKPRSSKRKAVTGASPSQPTKMPKTKPSSTTSKPDSADTSQKDADKPKQAAAESSSGSIIILSDEDSDLEILTPLPAKPVTRVRRKVKKPMKDFSMMTLPGDIDKEMRPHLCGTIELSDSENEGEPHGDCGTSNEVTSSDARTTAVKPSNSADVVEAEADTTVTTPPVADSEDTDVSQPLPSSCASPGVSTPGVSSTVPATCGDNGPSEAARVVVMSDSYSSQGPSHSTVMGSENKVISPADSPQKHEPQKINEYLQPPKPANESGRKKSAPPADDFMGAFARFQNNSHSQGRRSEGSSVTGNQDVHVPAAVNISPVVQPSATKKSTWSGAFQSFVGEKK